jgi:hypothetical protein
MSNKTRQWDKPFVSWDDDLKCKFVSWLIDTYGEKSAHQYFNEFRAVKDVEASVEPETDSYTEALVRAMQKTRDTMAANLLTKMWENKNEPCT